MLTTILMCQQGTLFSCSPARTQMVEELMRRGSKVVIFYPGNVDDEKLESKCEKIVNTKNMKISSIRNKIREINPNILVCSTIEDTDICYLLPYRMKNTDFYYYNLEIYVCSNRITINNGYNWINKIDYLQSKIKEILYVKRCSALVIQDKLRKKVSKKYWISHSNTWLIPNSYYSNFQKYNVPYKGGIIYSGSFLESMVGSLIGDINSFDNIEITLSGWGIAKGRLKRNPHIKVITQKLSQEDYSKFISAYDIALIWYSNQQDDNVYNIGLSSGKFFKHLSIGQPVIVNDVPGLADEVRKYKLGVVIKDLSELSMAVQTINSNYEFFVQNIKSVYDKKYDYKKVSKRFFDTIIDKAQVAVSGRKNGRF